MFSRSPQGRGLHITRETVPKHAGWGVCGGCDNHCREKASCLEEGLVCWGISKENHFCRKWILTLTAGISDSMCGVVGASGGGRAVCGLCRRSVRSHVQLCGIEQPCKY